MLIEDLVGKSSAIGGRERSVLETECSTFIKLSAGLPVYRPLPTSYNDFQKVKVRFQRKHDVVAEAFNKAFDHYHNFRQRTIFAYGQMPVCEGNVEPFYVFPINGFKFLYSKEVKNSNADYQQVLNTLFERFEDSGKAVEIVTDILKYTYVRENLVEGIVSDSEVLFYGIPFYYAIRVSSCPEYGRLIEV